MKGLLRAGEQLREIILAVGLLALVGTVIWFGSVQGWWGPEDGIMPGEAVAAFALEDMDGEMRAFHDFIGDRPVVLNFWATWCEPCIYEMPALQQLHENEDALVVGVNLRETPEWTLPYLRALEVTYPILYDRQGNITMERFRVADMPATLVINEEGTVCARVRGAPADPYPFFVDLLERMGQTCPVDHGIMGPGGA